MRADRSGARPAPDAGDRRSPASPSTRARCSPATCMPPCPGARAHGAAFAADGRRAGASRSSPTPTGAEPAGARRQRPCPVARRRRPRAASSARSRPRCYGHPAERLHDARHHRHQRQDDDRLPRRVGAARRSGSATGLIGTVETRDRRRAHRVVRTTPGGDRPARPARPSCASAGVDACVMEVSSHALALHRVDGVVYDVAALHQPLPGPPRLPRRRWRTTSRPRPRCSRPQRVARGVVCVDDDWGRAARSRGRPCP